jgi:hypothetical protein
MSVAPLSKAGGAENELPKATKPLPVAPKLLLTPVPFAWNQSSVLPIATSSRLLLISNNQGEHTAATGKVSAGGGEH